MEEKSEKLEIFIFSILYNFRNFVPKLKTFSDYSKKAINFYEMDEEKEKAENPNLNLDPELETIRSEIKNLVEQLKSKNYI